MTTQTKRIGLLVVIGMAGIISTVIPIDVAVAQSKVLVGKGLIIKGKKSVILHKGRRPVRIQDKLRVDKKIIARGNISLRAGKTVDGVDVSELQKTVYAIDLLPSDCSEGQVIKYSGTDWECAEDADTGSGTTYTAGSGIVIGGDTISATLGTTISLSELDNNAVGADQLASTAIEPGDIELADLPALASTDLTDTGSFPVLSNNETITGNWINTTNPWTDSEVDDDLTISGGTINNTTIGATTVSTGDFSSLRVNGTGVHGAVSPHDTTLTQAVIHENGGASSFVIGSDGLPFVVYADQTSTDIVGLHCGNYTCSTGNTSTILFDGSGADTDVVVGADGFPQIVYYEQAGQDLEFVDCTNITCAANSTTTIDSADSVGQYADIILNPADGFPQIFYYDATNTSVKVADCADATCGSTTITTIDNSAAVGEYISAAAMPNGLSIVTYFDSTNTDLLFGTCDNVTCTALTTTNPDTSASLNATAVTLGEDNLPLLIYNDNNNTVTLHCGNAACTSSNTSTTHSSDNGFDVDARIGADGLPLLVYTEGISDGDGINAKRCLTVTCATGQELALGGVEGNSGETLNLGVGPNGLPILLAGHGADTAFFYAKNNRFADYWTRE